MVFICEVLISHLGQEVSYPEIFLGSPQSLQIDTKLVMTALFNNFSDSVAVSSDVFITYEVEEALLNNQRIEQLIKIRSSAMPENPKISHKQHRR
jgi:hypothetical protein